MCRLGRVARSFSKETEWGHSAQHPSLLRCSFLSLGSLLYPLAGLFPLVLCSPLLPISSVSLPACPWPAPHPKPCFWGGVRAWDLRWLLCAAPLRSGSQAPAGWVFGRWAGPQSWLQDGGGEGRAGVSPTRLYPGPCVQNPHSAVWTGTGYACGQHGGCPRGDPGGEEGEKT